MITPGLLANKQFRNANLGMLFFAAGAIGTLLLLSLVFINLWGYEPIEAAFALVPVPLMGLVVWPLVGRFADIKPPGEIARPALIVMAIGMLWVSFLPSTAHDAWTYIRILPGLLMIGVGMGIGFPALNVGAMGAVAGPEIGLASGVLNTARQLGAAIGVAILIATFGGVLHAHMSWFADDEIEDVVDDWDMPAPMANEVIQSTLHDYTGGTQRPLRAQARVRRGDHPPDGRLGPRGLRVGVPPGRAADPDRAAAAGRAAPHARAGARGVHGADAGAPGGRRARRAPSTGRGRPEPRGDGDGDGAPRRAPPVEDRRPRPALPAGSARESRSSTSATSLATDSSTSSCSVSITRSALSGSS